jgi:DNA polymerase phi
MSTTLPLFWDLSSADKNKRLDASVKFIDTLEKFQASFEPKSPEGAGSSSGDEDEIMRGEDAHELDSMLDSLNAPDVAYSVRRLVRGLASPRESSRLGFAVALTEVMHKKLRSLLSAITNTLRAPFPSSDDFLRASSCASPRRHSHDAQPSRPRGARLVLCASFWSHRDHQFWLIHPHTAPAPSFSNCAEHT